VLQVVAAAQRRGAEIFPDDLVEAFDGAGIGQRVTVLPATGGPAVGYGAAVNRAGRDKLELAGMRMGVPGVRGLREVIRDWSPGCRPSPRGRAVKRLGPGRDRCPLPGRIPADRVRTRSIARGGSRRVASGGLMRRAACVVAVAEVVRQEPLKVSPPRIWLPSRMRSTLGGWRRPETVALCGGRSGIPSEADAILSLGALTLEKDPLVHVEIAGGVFAERPRAWHLVAGEGPTRSQVEAAVSGHQAGNRMRPLGARGDVADLLATSDVLLFASRVEGMEGMSAAVIEAGAAGLPMAGFAMAGVSEVLEAGRTGLLDPGGTDRLREHVLALVGDAEGRRTMGVAAHERCLARFDIQAVAPQYLDLCRTVTVAA
jgi:glycosyltransferase involved in cell wall biosynthesis